MKKTQFIELLHLIKSTTVSFISITLFITLSVAIYVGISGASVSSKKSMNDAIADTNYHDIQVAFPYGMSSSEIESLLRIDGVDEVEGTYTGYAYFAINNNNFQARLLTINDSIDKYISYQGELPERENEIGVDEFFAREYGLNIGDIIHFIPDNNGTNRALVKLVSYDTQNGDIRNLVEADNSPMAYLKADEFIITAFMRSPDYTYKSSTTYGISPENNLQVDCFAYLDKSAFDDTSLLGYTNVLIKSDSLSGYSTFSGAYQQKVKELTEKVKVEAVNDITNDKCNMISDKIEEIINTSQNALDIASSEMEAARVALENAMTASSAREGFFPDTGIDLEKMSEEFSESCSSLEEFKNKTKNFKKANASVMSQDYNAGFVIENTLCEVLNKSRYSMAALFVVVGLLVCYSAICRIINNQIINIGTKKALGVSTGDITFSFLLYTIIAIITGCLLGNLIGYFAVEKVLMAALSKNNTYPSVSVFSWKDALSISAVNFVLLLCTTYIACRKILKKNARELLAGPQIIQGKERFYERTGLWRSLSLYAKTIINNFFNDKRRVLGTIIGIAGSTALIVTALTLNNSISDSFITQYRDYFHFDTFVSYDNTVPNCKEEIEKVLDEFEIENANIFYTTVFLRNPSDQYFYFNILIPDDEEELNRLVTVVPTENYSGNTNTGFWIPDAYRSYFKTTQDDSVTLITLDGKERALKPGGYFKYHLLVYNGFMNKETYATCFDDEPQCNSFIIDTNGKDVEGLKEKLNTVAGFKAYSDYYEVTGKSYQAFAAISKAMVGVYTVLSVAMVFLVLLNLLMLFINEKKRELIVLMINGFSVSQAKRYIYTDTVFLTVIANVLGCLFGSVMGNVSIKTFESESTAFIHRIDYKACLIGVVCSVAMTVIVSIMSLRKIDKFRLTDINRE